MSTSKIAAVCLVLSLWGAVAHAGTHHYYYTDPQGTVLAKADAGGVIIATYDYAPYGTAVASMSPAPNGPGYTGHVNDPESGFVYMQARYYDPAVGRFIGRDPISPSAGNAFSFNRYAYVSNNPIANIDPDGKQCYGYGTHIPTCGDKILDCHQTNSCKSQAEADAIVRKDATSIVEIHAGIAAAAAGVAVVVEAAPVVSKAVPKKAAARAFCALVPILCDPKAVNTLDPNFDSTKPPETSEVDTRRQLEDLARWLAREIADRNRAMTPPPPPLPPPPPPLPLPPTP